MQENRRFCRFRQVKTRIPDTLKQFASLRYPGRWRHLFQGNDPKQGAGLDRSGDQAGLGARQRAVRDQLAEQQRATGQRGAGQKNGAVVRNP